MRIRPCAKPEPNWCPAVMSGATDCILHGQPQGEPQVFLDRLAPKTHGERGWQVVLVTAEPPPRNPPVQ